MWYKIICLHYIETKLLDFDICIYVCKSVYWNIAKYIHILRFTKNQLINEIW